MYVMIEPGETPAFLEEFQISVAMRRKGFSYGDIFWHKMELKDGAIITAADGTEFKLAR